MNVSNPEQQGGDYTGYNWLVYVTEVLGPIDALAFATDQIDVLKFLLSPCRSRRAWLYPPLYLRHNANVNIAQQGRKIDPLLNWVRENAAVALPKDWESMQKSADAPAISGDGYLRESPFLEPLIINVQGTHTLERTLLYSVTE